MERFQEVKTSAMEELVDTAKTSHPVVHRIAVAGHYGLRDGIISVLGATDRVQQRDQIRAVQHNSTTNHLGIQTRVKIQTFV